MSFLDVFLKVIAILGIIAVGTFIIVFLSDLLISVIDNSNGIFFKRNKNARTNGGTMGRPKMITQKQDEFEALTYDEKKVQEPTRPAVRQVQQESKDFEGIDYEKAREEERLAARASISPDSIDKRKAEQDEKTAERLRLIEARRREFEEAQRKEQEEDEVDEEEIRNIIANAQGEQNKVDKASVEKEVEDRLRREYEERELARQKAEEAERQAEVERQKVEEELRLAEQEAKHEEMLKAKEEEKVAAEAKLAEQEELLRAKEEELLRVKEEEKAATEARLKDIEDSNKQEKEQLEKEIELLKKQLETANSTVVTLTQKVNEKPEVIYEKVVTDNGMTKEEIEAKLALLKQRLKTNEKELSQNKKDFLPLKRVNMTLASDEKKLRRKEALVAKKKVLLYGVNNYVDIDEEKAKELAEELDLLEGLKLSVQHCEEVMKANKDRYPILEKANAILTKNVEDIKADIAELEARLKEFPADDDDTDGGKKMVEEPVKAQKTTPAPKAEKKAEEKKEPQKVAEVKQEPEKPAEKAEPEKKEIKAEDIKTDDDVEALVNEILGTNKKK